ncbi:DNA polymerase I [Sulfurirhabdus autotrophica]|uniref:DNA polymerase I n=1 Tax=Sulfurirhabdus autotrophica TaxID=1706046 RepID=A0A4R3Y8P5_9PROT|nr:DNA polymerase I [Sulfurirhabdus autotrophica]TCV88052.1 DNA polymerase I [Sulfurirhabdus autotrophica]
METQSQNNPVEPASSAKTLLLVDGSSYLYRAFHAMPDLRNQRNEPTGAIYGVLNMLRRLHKDHIADYSACVFDAKGKTFRDDWFPEYKAHRPPMPDDLRCQIEPLLEAIRAMGWPLLIVDGVEADDVIGTLGLLAEKEGIRTIISTGDKDMAQLVNPHVTLVNTMTNETLDREGVINKFGVPPERIQDYLTLVGDTVDNVPGVEKVGPKTAVKWLAEYGSLDNLVANADKIKGVVGDNLRKALDWLPMGYKLVTIKTDVPLPVEVRALHPQPQDQAKLTELFGQFGFKTWLREVGGEATDASTAATTTLPTVARNYETITTEAALNDWLARIGASALVSVDTETTGLDPMIARLVGISLSVETHHGAYIPLNHRYPGAPDQLSEAYVLQRLKPWLEDPSMLKLGQNIKYDLHIFANHGIKLAGVHHDTLLESYVLESHRPHDMDNMALRHLGVKTIAYAEVAGKGASQIGFEDVSIETAAEYAAEDADITLQLHESLYPQVSADSKLEYVYRHIEMPLIQILYQIERNGVLLDSRLLGIQSHELGLKIQELEKQAHILAGQPFNLNSPKQIQEILFTQQNLPVIKKTPGGTPSTDEDVLQKLAEDYPLPKLLLEYRGIAKLKSTYTDKLPRMVNPATGRVHTNYNQAVAITGRLASSEPNLQNIPVRSAEGRRIREAFIAPAGSHIVSADYSQIELRIMAHISQDASLLKAFAEGQDVHRATAAEIFGVAPEEVSSEQRRYAKVINFGLIYGMSAFGLAGQLGLERSAAQAYIDRYFARYPGVANYMQRTREEAQSKGYVETVFGRRLWLPEISGKNGPRRQAAERAAINAPMQGTAADLIKLAMIAVQGWLEHHKKQSMIIMQVHDELVLEVPDAELEEIKRELPRLMCEVAKLDVPLLAEVGVGPNWEQAH